MGEDGIKVAVREAGNDCVVTIEGELDAATVSDLVAVLDPLVMSGRHVVVDLSAVEFMDSQGLRALLVARQMAIRCRGSLVVTAVSGNVERVLDLTGTLPLLTGVYPAAED